MAIMAPHDKPHNIIILSKGNACADLVWKDADPDVPILKQAKAEYAKLR
jgi:hypothetical protein